MISGIDLTATVDYTLKDDVDNPTVWKIGVIPSYLLAQISSQAQGREIETAFRIIQVGLKGWDNFDIPYATEKETISGREVDVVPLSILERVPINVITELSTKIMDVNKLSTGETKN